MAAHGIRRRQWYVYSASQKNKASSTQGLIMAKDKKKKAMDQISLNELRDGSCLAYPAPTSHWSSCAAAASYCLAVNRHEPPETSMFIEWVEIAEASLIWEHPGTAECLGWKDRQIAVEWGAYGIAALLICRLTPYKVLERARKNGGFDFWLSEIDDSEALPFQHSARMEVSGIMRGNHNRINERVRKKLVQIARSNASKPRYVAVIEFSKPHAVVREK